MKDKETPPPILLPWRQPSSSSDLLALAPGSDCMETSEFQVGHTENESECKDWKTVYQVEAREKRKHTQLVSELCSTIRKKKMRLQEMETRYNETAIWVDSLIAQKDEMHKAHTAELEKMQQDERIFLENISSEHQQLSLHMEARDKELNKYEQELKKRQAHIELKERKVQERKARLLREKNERATLEQRKADESATLEQRKADENIMKLVEDHKREKEELHRRIIELEKQVKRKQALELVAEGMRCTLQGLILCNGDYEIRKTMVDTEEKLKQKEEELENLNQLNQTLIAKKQKTKDELEETKEELINGLAEHAHGNAYVGVKKMGDLDSAPFFAATRNSSLEGAQVKAAELCTQWVEYLADPDWYPFKIVNVEGSDSSKEIIDEEDERLSTLKKELGKEVYEAVTRALMELSEYNPSGRYVVLELWNFKEKRKATFHEGISRLLNKWKAAVKAKGKKSKLKSKKNTSKC